MAFLGLLICGFLYVVSALPSGLDVTYKNAGLKNAVTEEEVDLKPYLAFVYYRLPHRNLLSGAIISPSWVLTLGDLTRGQNISIWLSAGKNHEHQTRRSTKVVVHPGKGLTLVKVSPPFIFGDSVQPLALPNPDNEAVGDAIVSGWSIRNVILENNIIKEMIAPSSTNLSAISNKECEDIIYKNAVEIEPLAPEVLCATPTKDSKLFSAFGGPLVQDEVLLGVSNAIEYFAKEANQILTIFVRVTSYLDFIKKHVTDL